MKPHKPVKIEGTWISDSDPKDYMLREGKRNGLPCYQYDTLEAAVNACTRRGRGLRTCVDGGAHIGLWTMQLARVFKEVIAFEPVPENNQLLNMNIKEYGVKGVTTHKSALSNADGMIRLARRGGKSVSIGAHPQGEIEAVCHRLDTFNLQDVDLIKLDVEGHEHAALDGALETIRRCRPVIVIEEKHDASKRASALLRSLGMVVSLQKKHDYLFEWGPTN